MSRKQPAQIYRYKIKHFLEEQERITKGLEELAYICYKQELGEELEGLPVEAQGYKKVLRRLGFVV